MPSLFLEFVFMEDGQHLAYLKPTHARKSDLLHQTQIFNYSLKPVNFYAQENTPDEKPRKETMKEGKGIKKMHYNSLLISISLLHHKIRMVTSAVFFQQQINEFSMPSAVPLQLSYNGAQCKVASQVTQDHRVEGEH